MKKTIVNISLNGRKPRRLVLDDETPSASVYIEHDAFSYEQAKGLTKEQNLVAVMKRSAYSLYQTALQTIINLEDLDPEAAAELREAFGLVEIEDQAEE